jgi:alpha-ketoglutarate-dependent taurine dioxygenase
MSKMNSLRQRVQSLSPREKELLMQRLRKPQESPASQAETCARDGNRFPLSFAQQRLWFLQQLEPAGFTYNITIPTRLTGSLDHHAFEQSLNEIARRHEILRTTLLEGEGEPMQIIAPSFEVKVPVLDIQHLSEQNRAAELELLVQGELKRPFDVAEAPPWRCKLIRLQENEHVFILTLHHIVTDAWSNAVLFEELGEFYTAAIEKRPAQLAPLKIQYADYACRQREWLASEAGEACLNYWKQQLAGRLPVLNLPTDYARTEARSFRGAAHVATLSNELTQSLKQLSHAENATLFMTLLAAFSVLLRRYSNHDEIVIGTDVANRSSRETEALIGFFINLLVLRIDLSGNPTFRALLARVRDVSLAAYAHQEMPFDRLVVELGTARELNRSPLFEVLFVMQNAPQSLIKWNGLELTPVEMPTETARFDLALFVEETADGLAVKWNYSTDLFKPETITRLAGDFENLLRSLVVHRNDRIASLEARASVEQRQVDEEDLEESNRRRFTTLKPKAVRIVRRESVTTGYLVSGSKMPLVLKPATPGVDLAEWAGSHRSDLQAKLIEHGALLFRGFNLASVSDFERCAAAICPDLFSEYGDLPREQVSTKVYGSTPYPSNQSILFHNESSHLHRWPMKIWFFCVKAPAQGGETPIVDCRRVYELLPEEMRDRFARKRIMYVRNFTEGLDVSWQEFFRTRDRAVVEEQCRRAGIEYEWIDQTLRTRKVAVAVTNHPHTGEQIFFNQIQLHHPSYLLPKLRESLLDLVGDEGLPRNLYYGDASPIEAATITQIDEAYRRASVSFKWMESDLLMLDNMLTAHARNPFAGERKIVVAMGEMFSDQQNDQSRELKQKSHVSGV